MKPMTLLFLVFLVTGCDAFGTKGRLDRISRLHDPATVQLEPAFNDYVQRAFLPGGVELGVVSLKDGSQVKYWFISHHLVSDRGGAWFEFDNRERIFVTKLFCCEVQLGEEQPKDESTLHSLLSDWNIAVSRAR